MLARALDLQGAEDAQRLCVRVKASVVRHQAVEPAFAGVSKRGMPDIVGQTRRLDQRLVHPMLAGDAAPDLADLDRVGQSIAEVVGPGGPDYLGLARETPQRATVNDSITISDQRWPKIAGGLWIVRVRAREPPLAAVQRCRIVHGHRSEHYSTTSGAWRRAQRQDMAGAVVARRPTVERMVLWTGEHTTEADVATWTESVQRGRGVGWIHVRSGTPDALVALEAVAVPDLVRARLERLLADQPDGAPTAVSDGPVRCVTTVACRVSTDKNGPALERQHVRVLATSRWVVTVGPARRDSHADAIDVVVRHVDLFAEAVSPNGADLGLRLLLAIAETSAAAVQSLASGAVSDASRDHPRERLHRSLTELTTDVSRLRRLGHSPVEAWFPGASVPERAVGVAELLDDVLKRIASVRAEAQRRETQLRVREDQRRADSLQLVLGTVAAVLLGPSLAAGVLQAFPGWQPVDRRDDAFVGLSLASAGVLWLLVYAGPALLVRRRRGPASVIAVLAGTAAVIAGLFELLPIQAGIDNTPPQIQAACPDNPVERGSPATVEVAASDAEGALTEDPSGAHPLDTASLGAATVAYRAVDGFGHASTAACTYVVTRPPEPRHRRSASKAGRRGG